MGCSSSRHPTASWSRAWRSSTDPQQVSGRVEKETYTFLDDDIARFIEESRLRRGTQLDGAPAVAGPYERALRVLGGYIDQQQPRDVFLMEQEGSWLLRLLMGARTGMQHVLVEFTPDEIAMRADQRAGVADLGRALTTRFGSRKTLPASS